MTNRVEIKPTNYENQDDHLADLKTLYLRYDFYFYSIPNETF